MHKSFQARITENKQVNRHFKILGLHASSEIIPPEPGQFYMIQAGHTYDPLLKRPFSMFGYKDSDKAQVTSSELTDKGSDSPLLVTRHSLLQFLYRIRGRGTASLAGLEEGSSVQVIGPLGNGYPQPEGDFIAVAGGIGMASLFPLLERFRNRGYLFYGARSGDELVFLDRARAVSKEAFVSTDDGSAGQKGLITGMVERFLDSSRPLRMYACGPAPMLRALSKIVAQRGIRCFASLEEHMACGVGACLGCMVRTASGQKRICKEGPVFDIGEIAWE